jgi:hypothetical protein
MDINTISVAGSLFIGFIGITTTFWINLKLIKQKNREDEKKEIYKN